MGNATKQALHALAGELGTWHGADLGAARELLDLVGELDREPALRAALAEPEADPQRKRELIDRVFGRAGEQARALLAQAASKRWSDDADFASGAQELGIRAVAQFTGQASEIAAELLAVEEAVTANGELELALSSKLSPARQKLELVDRLLGGKVSEPTMAIIRSVLSVPMGRRVRRALDWAAQVVTDQASRSIARVTSAVPLPADQVARLQTALSRRYGRDIQIAPITDPAVLGGLRVELGDDVIDDTVASRLHDLRRAIA